MTSRSTTSSTWLVRKIVIAPRATRSCRSRRIPLTATASMPSNGSSRNRSCGPWMSAQPRASFFFMPWLYSPTSLPRLVRELERPEQLVGAPSRLAAVEPVELAVDPELLRAGEPLEQGEAVRHHAHAPLHRERIAIEIDPEHARAPRGRGEQARQHLDGRALPGAVRAEETVERASRHGEREPLHGGAPVEQPREPLRLDRERHVPSSTAGTLRGRDRIRRVSHCSSAWTASSSK